MSSRRGSVRSPSGLESEALVRAGSGRAVGNRECGGLPPDGRDGVARPYDGCILFRVEPGHCAAVEIYIPRLDDSAEAGERARVRIGSRQGSDSLPSAAGRIPEMRDAAEARCGPIIAVLGAWALIVLVALAILLFFFDAG